VVRELAFALVTTGAEVNQDTIDRRLERAADNAASKEGVIDNYFDDAIKYTSDPQNVHDSKVNNDLRGVLARIKCDVSPAKSIQAAQKYIAENHTGDKAERAMRTLELIATGSWIGTYSDSEDRIFSYVWDRSEHQSNADNSDLMRDAVVDALADSVENNSLVCINGRTSRLLNSLTLLDFNPVVAGGALTFEAYKNQIFDETKTIIKQEAENAKFADNEALRNVGLSFSGEDVEVDPTTEREWINSVKSEIDRNLSNYASKLTIGEIEKIKGECYAAVDF
jgi:hypothetical protein